MKKKPLSVRLDPRLYDSLQDAAAAHNCTLTEAVEAAIRAWVGEGEVVSLADRLAALEEWRDSLGKLQRVA